MNWYQVLGTEMYLSDESAKELERCTEIKKLSTPWEAKRETISLENIKAVLTKAAALGKAATLKDFYEYF